MLELTQEQVRALVQDETQPTTLIDPGTQTTYVLLRRDEYERLVEKSDDDACRLFFRSSFAP